MDESRYKFDLALCVREGLLNEEELDNDSMELLHQQRKLENAIFGNSKIVKMSKNEVLN